VQVCGEGSGEAVGEVDGDGWERFAQEGTRCAEGGGEEVEDKGEDHVGVKDEECGEAKGMGFEGEAEGVGLCLVDVSMCSASEGREACCADKAWDGGAVSPRNVGGRVLEGAEYGGGGGAGVFRVVTAVGGVDEGREEIEGDGFDESEGVGLGGRILRCGVGAVYVGGRVRGEVRCMEGEPCVAEECCGSIVRGGGREEGVSVWGQVEVGREGGG
jgi:hypothetical protein